jgi:hypothetical protein
VFVNFEQPEKHSFPIKVINRGRMICVKLIQRLKEPSPNEVIRLENFI